MNILKKEWNFFIACLSYFTRIKILVIFSEEEYRKGILYLPIAGIWIAILGILFWFILEYFFLIKDIEILVLFILVFTIFLTGALHEDGLSDTLDGLGGGYFKQKILEIMKDHRTGNFGVLSLIFVILFKYVLLKKLLIISKVLFIFAYICSHFLSRWIIIFFIYFLPYAKKEGKSNIFQNISKNRFLIFQGIYVFILISCGFILYFFYKVHIQWLFIFFILYFFLFVYFRNLLLKKIEGYTGDTLGAIQQISEVFIYFYIWYISI